MLSSHRDRESGFKSPQNLNRIERLKIELAPYLFEERLGHLDWENLTESDRFYLKNYGIYNIKLRPKKFMIRVRFDGVDVPISALETILEIVEEFNLSLIITSRGGLEIHNISPESVYRLYLRLRSSGIKTHQSLTDNFRAITTDPFDGFAEDSLIDTTKIIKKIRDAFLDNREFFGTVPRKFNTSFVGRVKPIDNFWANDALFGLAEREERVGFNLYLGGKNSQVAKSVNIFVVPKDAFRLFFAVVEVYKRYGLRGSRAKTRLFHLIESVGVEEIRLLIEREFGKKIEEEGRLLIKRPKDVEFIELRDNLFGYRVLSKYGEIESHRIREIIELHREYNLIVRFGIDQNIYLISKERLNLKRESKGSKSLQIVSCVGSRYCPLSLWDIKRDVEYLPTERLKRLGIKIGFSGCLKGCGRHYHTDIGLIGLRTNLYAPTERAFRVFIGAMYSGDSVKPARMLYYSVPKREMNTLIENILDDFEGSNYSHFSNFSRDVLSKYSIDFLQLWYIAKALFKLNRDDFKQFILADDEVAMVNRVGRFIDGGVSINNLSESIKKLSHRLWDLKR